MKKKESTSYRYYPQEIQDSVDLIAANIKIVSKDLAIDQELFF